MIERKEGVINNIVYDYTVYHHGDYHYYLAVPQIFKILNLIVESNQTTKSLRVFPYYRNEKLQHQIEFENMIFYIKCDYNVTFEQRQSFLKSCCEDHRDVDNDIQTRFCLCDFKDVFTYQRSIIKYCEYLKMKIPEITDFILNEYKIEGRDLLYGYICFEIYSE